jgi:two-component system NtrC family sensor kinase
MTRARTLRLLLCLLLAVATAVLGGVSVRRKIGAFQPVGFIAERAGALVRVAQVNDAATGLRRGDEILLVDGGETGGPESLAVRLRERPQEELAVLRGGQVASVAYHRPPLAPDVPFLIRVLIGTAYLLIGLYTLIRRQSRESLLFCLWCLTSALLYLLSPVPPADMEYRLIFFGDELARCLLPALTLHLFLVFPSADAGGRGAGAAKGAGAETAAIPAAHGGPAAPRRLIAFLYLPGAVLLSLQLDLMLWNGRWLFGHMTAAKLTALDHIDLLHLAAYGMAAVAVLAYRLLREPGWEQRRQLHWMIYGLAGGYLPFLVFYVVPLVLGVHLPQLLAAAAILPLALVPLTFAYAILRYKLWDIEVIARDIVSATLTLLLGVLGFSLANLAILRGVSPDPPLARNLLSFAAGLGIAGLLVPTRQSLSAALERLQYRGTFGKRRALLDLGRDLLHERDLAHLCSALLERLAGGMDLERAGLYLMQGEMLVAIDAVDLRPAHGEGKLGLLPDRPGSGSPHGGRARLRHTQAAPPPVIASRSLDQAIWRETDFFRLAGTELPAGQPSPLQLLFIAGYRYAFPLTVRGRAIGLALTGYKRDMTPLNSEDSGLIRHLLNQAALAIENAQLLGQLHLQLQEVQRLQSYSDGIFESSPAGIAVLDGDRRLVSANPAFAVLVGRERQEVFGRRIEEVLPDLPLPAAGAPPLEVSYQDPALPAGAPPRILQMSLADLAPSRSPQREPLHILVVYDVSERVAMEKALKEKDRLAALGMLAAGVAHEVNTPLTGISSYAQMLLSDTAENDPRHAILKKVERQTFRASRIVNNLLELARDRPRERHPVPIVPLLRECVELFGDRLEVGAIDLEWDLPAGGEDLQVVGSDGELQQVFSNLLGNALDAMAGEEHGTLAIGVAAGPEEVTVSIRDSGAGIPSDRLQTVFQPFYSTKLHRGGTGLGLTISHDIVQRHGGRLEVTSAAGEGACFEVALPRLESGGTASRR